MIHVKADMSHKFSRCSLKYDHHLKHVGEDHPVVVRELLEAKFQLVELPNVVVKFPIQVSVVEDVTKFWNS